MSLGNNLIHLKQLVFRIAGVAPTKAGSVLLPIIGSTVLVLESYKDFALSYVLAMAVSAFSGESLAITVSKLFDERKNLLNILFKTSCIVFIITIIVAAFLYQVRLGELVISYQSYEVLFGAFFLCAINIFIPPSINLIMLRKPTVQTVCGINVMVLISITTAFLVGKATGLVGMVFSYSLILLVGTTVILNMSDGPQYPTILFNSDTGRRFFKSYSLIALAASFGGPVHGICLLLLGAVEHTGRLDLATFVLYYPFAVVVSFIPSLNSTFVINHLENTLSPVSKHILQKIFFSNFILMMAVCVPLLMMTGYIHRYYENQIGEHTNMLPIMLIIGALLGTFTISSSVLIALRNPNILLKPSIVQALCYLGTTYIGTTYFEFNAVTLGLSLAGSISVLLAYHALIIINST